MQYSKYWRNNPNGKAYGQKKTSNTKIEEKTYQQWDIEIKILQGLKKACLAQNTCVSWTIFAEGVLSSNITTRTSMENGFVFIKTPVMKTHVPDYSRYNTENIRNNGECVAPKTSIVRTINN